MLWVCCCSFYYFSVVYGLLTSQNTHMSSFSLFWGAKQKIPQFFSVQTLLMEAPHLRDLWHKDGNLSKTDIKRTWGKVSCRSNLTSLFLLTKVKGYHTAVLLPKFNSLVLTLRQSWPCKRLLHLSLFDFGKQTWSLLLVEICRCVLWADLGLYMKIQYRSVEQVASLVLQVWSQIQLSFYSCLTGSSCRTPRGRRELTQRLSQSSWPWQMTLRHWVRKLDLDEGEQKRSVRGRNTCAEVERGRPQVTGVKLMWAAGLPTQRGPEQGASPRGGGGPRWIISRCSHAT